MDKPSNAFATDEAADIIIAGIESGAIGFPFLQAFNQERFQNSVKGDLKEVPPGQADIFGQKVNEAIRNKLPSMLGYLARADAMYLLCLRQTLITGLTEEEAERVVSAAIHGLM